MEKREHPRGESHIQVWYQTFTEDNMTFGLPKSKNISAGGMLLSMSESTDVGTNLIMKFRIPDYEEKILARGKVVRVNRIDKENYDTGIQFLNIREKDCEAIQKLIELT
ncbi:MAG: PilZ domain-containing protein [Spirochaetes bacterium]|nr:PilZ domain-containing protein [Spirochaetota bacterium]